MGPSLTFSHAQTELQAGPSGPGHHRLAAGFVGPGDESWRTETAFATARDDPARFADHVPADVCNGPSGQGGQGAPSGIGVALAVARSRLRDSLPFRAVNKRESLDYDPGLQRHHLLPRQLLQRDCFGPLFDLMGRERIGFEDFRSNGLLLPASDMAALRIGLPMHRGPHHDYNALVIERVGQVESGWSAMRLRAPEMALTEAVGRLKLLQRALRRRLLDSRLKRFKLNRHDPLGREKDFSDLDQMAESLWGATQPHPEEVSLMVRPTALSPSIEAPPIGLPPSGLPPSGWPPSGSAFSF